MRLILALTVALAAMWPTVSHAQSKEDIREAKKLSGDGKALYEAGEYADAAAAYLRAYELSGRTELLFNVGQSFRLAGKLREAEARLQQYLAEAPQAANADEVVTAIVEIQQQIAADLATVQIETLVPGRGVFVDDEAEPRCLTPCAVMVSPGARRLTLRGSGAEDQVEQLVLEPGQTLQLTAELPAAVGRGWLRVSTDRPAGTVEVGDVRLALPLAEPLALESGEHSVMILAARNARWTGNIVVAPDETTELFVPMQSVVDARKRGSLRKSVSYGLWGVSLAGLGGGLLLGAQARTTFRKLEADSASNRFVDDELVRQGRNQQRSANLLFVGASAALLTGTVLFLWDQFAPDRDPTPE